jgi:hypothetical protein
MARYSVNDFMVLLKLSLAQIKYYHNKYNKKPGNHKYKNKLDYHIFSFTQIAFAVHERVKLDYFESWETKGKPFFEKDIKPKKTEIGIIIDIANKYKHKDSLDLTQHWSDIKPYSDGIYRPTKVEKIIKIKHNLNHRDKSLIEIFRNAHNQLDAYVKQL